MLAESGPLGDTKVIIGLSLTEMPPACQRPSSPLARAAQPTEPPTAASQALGYDGED